MDAESTGQGCPNCERLEQVIRDQQRQIAALEKRVAELTAQVEKLSAALEEAQRAGKRQAAPFSKGRPKKRPQKPGRKPGKDYGQHARRRPPEQIDETYEAPLPETCPHCGGREITETGVAAQYQTEIPRQPIHRQINVHRGTCRGCGNDVQGRHPVQTSDALGAAAVQLGPDLHAALAVFNKRLGLSHGKCAALLKRLFGIDISRSTVARSLRRSGQRCEPNYEEIRQSVRGSPWVVCDETGWRIGGNKAWLHAFVGETATCYAVDPTRSHLPAEELLTAEYEGVMIHDGWSPYDRFEQCPHQQCLRHPMVRARKMLETATGGAARFPRAVLEVFRKALSLRDRFAAGEVSPHGRATARSRLIGESERLVRPVKTHPANERLAAHLEKYLEGFFTFLYIPGIDATNWRAEQALRPAVVNRKVWGGNRTPAGARTQSVLTSVLVTCHQRGHDALTVLSQLLRSPVPLTLPTG